MNIEVTATPSYLVEQSDPANGRFVFAYAIQIHNAGDRSVQLLTRYWQVDHGDGRVEEIHGEGVVGEQPVLQPGAVYRYQSGAILQSPVGGMSGHYGFVDEQGNAFQVPIPHFDLIAPRSTRTLH